MAISNSTSPTIEEWLVLMGRIIDGVALIAVVIRSLDEQEIGAQEQCVLRMTVGWLERVHDDFDIAVARLRRRTP